MSPRAVHSSDSLTAHLLTINQDQLKRATQTTFLRNAASGTLPKQTISHWLANDRLYMQGYIKLTGQLLRILQLPLKPTPSSAHSNNTAPTEIKLIDWLTDALVNIRREEKFFIDVAERYGLDVDISDASGTNVIPDKKILGLTRFDELFTKLSTGEPSYEFLPWLEAAVVFWATETIYFTAWSWAKGQAGSSEQEERNDEDGGAMRKEFIPNWTNEHFKKFVDVLERIVDGGVREAVKGDEKRWGEIRQRAEKVWSEVLNAEEAFWPVV